MACNVVPLHKYKKYLMECCRMLNDEWKRSDTARLRSLENSSDTLPTSLILLEGDKLIGHVKLSPIRTIQDACFVEAVVIDKNLRGKGYGTKLMLGAENYCKEFLNLKTIYLSTKGQEKFYSKLGYIVCEPISIYGSSSKSTVHLDINNFKRTKQTNCPPPPPMPSNNFNYGFKTYMRKNI